MTVVGDGARGYVVVLEAGRARFDVPPRGERPPFRVHAGATRVEVVGTVFEVTLGAGEAAGVRVEHGTVRVSDPRGTRLLTAGQRIAADPRDDGGPTAATTEPPSTLGPAAAPAEPRPRATHRVPVGEVHPPPAPDAEAATSPGHPEAVEAATPPRAAPATEPSRQALYERAARLERAEPGASLALYRSLADGDDAWARLALFAAGRLAHEQARQGEARRLLERYLARYPEGPNAADAHAILER